MRQLGKKPCVPEHLRCKTGTAALRTAYVSWYLDEGYTEQQNRAMFEYMMHTEEVARKHYFKGAKEKTLARAMMRRSGTNP